MEHNYFIIVESKLTKRSELNFNIYNNSLINSNNTSEMKYLNERNYFILSWKSCIFYNLVYSSHNTINIYHVSLAHI